MTTYPVAFRHGDPSFADYTPSAGNVAAGSVVLIGNTTGLSCGIAHLDIANGVMGSVAVGGGIYDVTMLTNLPPGQTVYWDVTNSKVTSTSTNNALFGYLITGNTGANTVVRAIHIPYGAKY